MLKDFLCLWLFIGQQPWRQFDAYYNIKKGTALGGKYGTKIAFNASYWANLSGDYDFAAQDYDVDFFGFGEKYFSDISLEVRKKLSPDLNTIFTYVNQYYNKEYLLGETGVVKANIGVAEANYSFNQKQSLRFVIQHLWTDDDKKLGGRHLGIQPEPATFFLCVGQLQLRQRPRKRANTLLQHRGQFHQRPASFIIELWPPTRRGRLCGWNLPVRSGKHRAFSEP